MPAHLDSEERERTAKLTSIRRQLLDSGLLAFVALATPALIASLARSLQTGWQPLMWVQAAVYATFVGNLVLRARAPQRARALVFTVGLLVVGLGGVWTYGLTGMGIFLLALSILFAAMLLSRSEVVGHVGLALGGVALTGFAAVTDRHSFAVDFNTYSTTTTAWVSALLTLATVVAAIVGLRRMNRSVLELVDDLADQSARRRETNLHLEAEVEARTAAEAHLFAEKEKAQTTLQSIGDAVITTDAECCVEYLNPVAESMTGWSLEEAMGRPIEEVFHILDEVTREVAEQPVRRCLATAEVVGLANGTALVQRDGRECLVRDSAAPIRQPDGTIVGTVLVFQDATEERTILREARYHAAHDGLTGLINRREFEIRLERALASALDRHGSHCLCYLDLDHFKTVNDVAGHLAGDALLKQVAEALEQQVRSRDSLARLGGDEFALLLENCQPVRAYDIAEKLVDAVRRIAFSWEGAAFDIGVSIGMVEINERSESVTELLRHADTACYTAKDLGRDRVALYAEPNAAAIRRQNDQQLASRLREALRHDRFALYRQPIYALNGEDSSRPFLYEILLRLDDGETVLPGQFIPAAERVGIMPEIDRWVIHHSLAAVENADESDGEVGLSINLSGVSLNDRTLSPFVQTEFANRNVKPERICFEITETAAIEHRKRALDFMREMKELGCRFALDDFGSGLSSFAYLKQLPVDFLKIDGELIREIDVNRVDRAMVRAISELARTLGISMIAEYVERGEIAEELRELGVDYAQGFSLGEPTPLLLHPSGRPG